MNFKVGNSYLIKTVTSTVFTEVTVVRESEKALKIRYASNGEEWWLAKDGADTRLQVFEDLGVVNRSHADAEELADVLGGFLRKLTVDESGNLKMVPDMEVDVLLARGFELMGLMRNDASDMLTALRRAWENAKGYPEVKPDEEYAYALGFRAGWALRGPDGE